MARNCSAIRAGPDRPACRAVHRVWESKAHKLLSYFLLISAALPPSCLACARLPEPSIVGAVQDMYRAAAADDLNAFHQVTTADFYAFEGGRRLNGDALMEMVKAGHAQGKIWVWTVKDPEIHLDCNTAWLTYTNTGSVSDSAGTLPVNWLESANLIADKGRWRIRFFSSTRVPQP